MGPSKTLLSAVPKHTHTLVFPPSLWNHRDGIMMCHKGLNWLHKAIKPCEQSREQKEWISITHQDDFSQHSTLNFRLCPISALLKFINPDLQKLLCLSLNAFSSIEAHYWGLSETSPFCQEPRNAVIEKHRGNVVGMCLSLSANPCSVADMIWRSPLKAYLRQG